jgi:hypothetical protein
VRTERAGLAAVALMFVVAAACERGGGGSRAVDCGVPTPDPAARAALIPEPFLLDGDATVATAGRRRGGVTAVLSVQTSVQDALPPYKKAIAEEGFELVGEDNEGFEAEIYLRHKRLIGAVQIRRSLCDDASVVFVNFVPVKLTQP